MSTFMTIPKLTTLNGGKSFTYSKGVASGLFCLHEDWEQVVIHREIKSRNVLLDAQLNGSCGILGFHGYMIMVLILELPML